MPSFESTNNFFFDDRLHFAFRQSRDEFVTHSTQLRAGLHFFGERCASLSHWIRNFVGDRGLKIRKILHALSGWCAMLEGKNEKLREIPSFGSANAQINPNREKSRTSNTHMLSRNEQVLRLLLVAIEISKNNNRWNCNAIHP